MCGCVPPQAAASTAEDLAIVCWLGKVSLSLMVSKPDCALLLDRIGLDPSKAHAKPNAMQVSPQLDYLLASIIFYYIALYYMVILYIWSKSSTENNPDTGQTN